MDSKYEEYTSTINKKDTISKRNASSERDIINK